MVDKPTTAVIPSGHAATRAVDSRSLSRSRRGGLVLEAIDGPMDGALIAKDLDAVHIGRHLDCDLSLHGDLLVSSRHAILRRTSNPAVWSLEDAGSANGTWVDGMRLMTAHRIQAGGCFVVGQSVIRCLPEKGMETELRLEPQELTDERHRLLDLSSTGLRQGFGAAAMLACRERKGFINDRHFFLGLAMTEADLPILERGEGPISFDFLNQMLLRSADWTGVEEWIHKHLREIQISNFFTVSLPVSPRVIHSLRQAEEIARKRGRGKIDPVDWFRAVLADPASRISRILAEHRLRPEGLAADLASVSVHREPSRQILKTMPSGKHRAEPAPRALTSGDRTLDHRAQELSRRLYGLASLYHLAATEDRRMAMRQMLTQELAPMAGDQRRLLLEQVRRLFPVDPGSSEGAQEVARLNNRIAQLEQRVAEAPQSEPSIATAANLPWHLIVLTKDKRRSQDQNFDGLSPIDRPRAEFLQDILGFGIAVERFVVGMVQGLTVRTTTSTALTLPGHRMSIKAYLDDMEAGRQVRRDALSGYLSDLEVWLVASLTAYHEGPEQWFKKLWKKISPAVIEANFSGWAQKLGLQQWDHYKTAVRRINPEVATQQILFEVRRIAEERHLEYIQRETQR